MESNLIDIKNKIRALNELRIKIESENDSNKKRYVSIVKDLKELGIEDVRSIKSHMEAIKENLDKDNIFMDSLIKEYQEIKWGENL